MEKKTTKKTRVIRINGSRKNTKEIPLLDLSEFPHNEKGAAIVPDQFFQDHLKELPEGTVNESGTKRAYNGGSMIILGADPEKDKEVHRAGAAASNATQAQRKTFAEMFNIMLRQKDENGLTHQEKIVIGQMAKAEKGDTKAAVFVRDTIGEMPVTKQQISADVTTEADRALMEKLSRRLQEDAQKGES